MESLIERKYVILYTPISLHTCSFTPLPAAPVHQFPH